MAKALDLQEQEQIDEIKAFWSQWGTAITLGLAVVLGGFAAYNGWNLWQRKQAEASALLYDQVIAASLTNDPAKAALVFGELKDRYGSTIYAANAGLLTAKIQVGRGLQDDALKSLGWVADKAGDPEVKTMARLQAAGVLLDQKKWDDAIKWLDATGKPAGSMGALVEDRRGDVLLAMGKTDEAKVAYTAAYQGMDEKLEYRQLIDAKLAALGAAPPAKTTPKAGTTSVGATK